MSLKSTMIPALLLVMLAGLPSAAQREVVDRIVAVVGERVILGSELANQIRWTAFQTGREPRTEQELEELKTEILEQMISDQLFLIAAQKDTAISVRPEEVDEELDNRISSIAGGFSSHEEFLASLTAEGMSLRDLRKRFRGEVENQILKQRFIQSRLVNVSISKREVEEFYREFKDSIPDQPEAVKLAHVLLPIQPSPEVEDSTMALATRLRQDILDGADFAVISAQYSSLGAGADGGDLGYISRSDVVDEFARAAFRLQVGDISGVVRTQFGYHVIKCEDKRGDQLKLRHLLLAVQPSPEDTARTTALADSLTEAARQGASFEEMAKVYSDDDDSRVQGGELGWFAVTQLPPEFAEVAGWTAVGEFRGPISSQFGLHILKLLDYQPHKKYTLEDDFDQIKQMARQDKTGRLVDSWIDEIKTKTHIEYRLDD